MADELDAMFPTEHQVAEPDKVETVVEPQEPVAEALPPEPEPPAPEAEPIVPEEPKRDTIPIAALMDERDKRKALEAELRQIREAQARAEPQQVPDALDDPVGHNAYIQREIANAVQQQKVDTSWHLALRDYGKDTVESAKTWALEKAQSDPIFRNQVDVAFQAEALPIDWVVQQHKRDANIARLGGKDLDEYIKEYVAQNPQQFLQSAAPLAAAPVVAPTQPAPKAPTPPRSIASDASPARTGVGNDGFNVFDGLLTR